MPCPDPVLYEVDGTPLWEVQDILNVRRNPTSGTWEALVKWKGSGYQDEWVDFDLVSHVDQAKVWKSMMNIP